MFSEGVERAVVVALRAHAGQLRRHSGAPYVVHPVHIGLMLSRLGADSDVVQAGLLHDVVEDSDEWTLERIEIEFGVRVASIVAELTEDKSRTWGERKETGVRSIPELSEGALLVKALDKLHNLVSLGRALRDADDADAVWSAFRGGRDRSIEMARRAVGALVERLGAEQPGLAHDLQCALDGLREA